MRAGRNVDKVVLIFRFEISRPSKVVQCAEDLFKVPRVLERDFVLNDFCFGRNRNQVIAHSLSEIRKLRLDQQMKPVYQQLFVLTDGRQRSQRRAFAPASSCGPSSPITTVFRFAMSYFSSLQTSRKHFMNHLTQRREDAELRKEISRAEINSARFLVSESFSPDHSTLSVCATSRQILQEVRLTG